RETYSESLNRFEPNPDLQPEHLVAMEGGLTTKLGRGELQVVGFHHNLTDAIRRVTLPDKKRQRVNSDRLRSTGIEVLLTQLVGPVSLGGDLTLQSVHLTDPGTRVSTRPENLPERSGSAHVRVPMGSGFTAGAEARYTGAQFCQDPDSGADVKLDGGTWVNGNLARTWDLSTNLGMLSRMETRLSAENLSNRALYDQCGLPRPGRLLRLQIRLF
ncbi:MAG TPA: TonB-dependent receptor, partial [Longimicrobiales bacterium]|nr:TonB-dependent receptor [Longimicrobiales bacterium]